MAPDAFWTPSEINSDASLRRQEAAFEEACRRLGATTAGEPRYGFCGKSRGSRVIDGGGRSTWLKVAESAERIGAWQQTGEATARLFEGVPRAQVLEQFDWREGTGHWRAIRFELAPSPAISDLPWLRRPVSDIDDDWLRQLKSAIERIGDVPISRWSLHPGLVARTIGARFGRKAPYEVEEWRTAHGDLNWANLTAPRLCLLDWELWGAAPRGLDAATLLAHSLADPTLYRRLESLFADDLETRSGLVARLHRLARTLDAVEAGYYDPRLYRAAEKEAQRLLRQ